MQMLVGLLLSIVLGYRAKQKGRDGLKFGAGVATALLAPLAALQAWDQVAGVHPALWWVLAAFVTCIAWLRLEKPSTGAEAKLATTERKAPMAQNVQVDGPVGSAVASGSHEPKPKPWSTDELRQVWAEQKAYLRQHKIKGSLRILGGLYALLFVIVGLYKGASYVLGQQVVPTASDTSAPAARSTKQAVPASGHFLVPAARFEAADMARLMEAKMPADMPIASWADQGFGYSDRTRIFMRTDNFGKVTEVDVEQLGVKTSTGAVHPIPKFALRYSASAAKATDILMMASLNGPGFPVRLSFDADPSYVELSPNAGEFVTGKMSGKVLEGMRTATQLKITHGVSAGGGELALTYDLNEFRNAIAAALATLGKAN